jgi:hypothetical protein
MGDISSPEWRRLRVQLNRKLLDIAGELKRDLDLIFCVVYDDFLLPDTARKLSSLDIPMVNYHVDMVTQWYRILRTARYFDAIAVAQLANIEHLKKYARKIIHVPMAANPRFFSVADEVNEYNEMVSFVGSATPFRVHVLSTLIASNIPVSIYGRLGWVSQKVMPQASKWNIYKIAHDMFFYGLARWRAEGLQSIVEPLIRKFSSVKQQGSWFIPTESVKGFAPWEALPRLFRSSLINLGFTDVYGGSRSKRRQIRLREFEVPMSGGFYLTQYTPEIDLYYEVGTEIEVWYDIADLCEKINYYIAHPEEAEAIRERGKQRALKDHTWENRFKLLFEELRI